MGLFILAWIVGESFVIYRTAKTHSAPPAPGQLLVTSGVFVMLALMAESNKTRPLAVTLAWGFDIAAFMSLYGNPPKKDSSKMWPPAVAPNTVILPTGVAGKDASLISEFKDIVSEFKPGNSSSSGNDATSKTEHPSGRNGSTNRGSFNSQSGRLDNGMRSGRLNK